MDYNKFCQGLRGLGLSKKKEELWLGLFGRIDRVIGLEVFVKAWFSFNRDFFRVKYVYDNFYVFDRFIMEDFVRVYGLDFRDKEYIDYCESMSWLLEDLFHNNKFKDFSFV